MFGARQDARLFSRIDTFSAASVVGPTTQANFNEDDREILAHDEIDLTVTATIVTLEEPQAMVD